MDAAIFSKDDLTVNGGGSLTATGNMKHGIVSKDTLVISGGVIDITALQDGVQANDAATISGGVVIAAGAGGMAAGLSDGSAQGSITVNVGTQEGGTPVALCDESGAALCAFTPVKQYQNVAVSCHGIVSGADTNGWAENAEISGASMLATVEMTSLHYSEGGGMGNMGGPGGNMSGRSGRAGDAPSRDDAYPADGTAPSGGFPNGMDGEAAPDFPGTDAAASVVS